MLFRSKLIIIIIMSKQQQNKKKSKQLPVCLFPKGVVCLCWPSSPWQHRPLLKHALVHASSVWIATEWYNYNFLPRTDYSPDTVCLDSHALVQSLQHSINIYNTQKQHLNLTNVTNHRGTNDLHFHSRVSKDVKASLSCIYNTNNKPIIIIIYYSLGHL